MKQNLSSSHFYVFRIINFRCGSLSEYNRPVKLVCVALVRAHPISLSATVNRDLCLSVQIFNNMGISLSLSKAFPHRPSPIVHLIQLSTTEESLVRDK